MTHFNNQTVGATSALRGVLFFKGNNGDAFDANRVVLHMNQTSSPEDTSYNA